MKRINIVQIGIIHSPFETPSQTPIQATTKDASDVEGTVELFPEYEAGLKDIDGFSHIILVYCFDRVTEHRLLVIPFLDTIERGVFATRAPSRPNPIGISIVRLLGKINENTLAIQGIDILDNTPLIDIKPYIPEFDQVHADKIGWISSKIEGMDMAHDDGRFS
jgi:tRNA (adenine37-N6)-methyltransferase